MKTPRKLKGKQCQCAACGQLFIGTTFFERHRTGPYSFDPKSRRCLAPAEMLAKGMRLNAEGFWGTEENRKVKAAA